MNKATKTKTPCIVIQWSHILLVQIQNGNLHTKQAQELHLCFIRGKKLHLIGKMFSKDTGIYIWVTNYNLHLKPRQGNKTTSLTYIKYRSVVDPDPKDP